MQHDAVWFVPFGAIENDLSAGLLATLQLPLSGTEEPIGLLRRIDLKADAAIDALIEAVREAVRQRSIG